MTRPFRSRSFEHHLRRPAAAAAGVGGAGADQKTRYERLMRVALRHSYYNRAGGGCPDFTIQPTPTTAALMRRLGLLWRAGASDFSVLYDMARTESLVRFLRLQAEGEGIWTRLSFVLALTNPLFVNFTAIPLDTNPSTRNLYFTNREAHAVPGEDTVLLNPGSHVTGRELLPVIPPQVSVDWLPEAETIVVRDLSGAVILSQPRPPGGSPGKAFLDFSPWPEGSYTWQQVGPGGWIPPATTALYTLFDPMPLAFIDLLLADPTGSEPGVYPVQDPFGEGEVVPVDYELRFERRATVWSYFVVPEPAQELADLAIEGGPPAFSGPTPVVLPGGRPAWRFEATAPIALAELPTVHFRLRGRSRLLAHERVLMDRLPAASPRGVMPGGDPSPTSPAVSDVYVHI